MTFLKVLRILLKKPKKKRRLILRSQGLVYNLQDIYNSLNHKYFDSKLDLRITWFGRGEKVPQSRMTFGSYNSRQKLIKINRLLDKSDTPEHFVHYIVFHEMLHEVFPPVARRRGGHHIHHKEFKEREKEFLMYEPAKDYLKQWKKTHFTDQKKLQQ
jgi:hypothetical protein